MKAKASLTQEAVACILHKRLKMVRHIRQEQHI